LEIFTRTVEIKKEDAGVLISVNLEVGVKKQSELLNSQPWGIVKGEYLIANKGLGKFTCLEFVVSNTRLENMSPS
jgi:hypothetical protein